MLPSMYAKLFSRIAQSSLMEEDIETRYCFMMLLAIADSGGDVIGTDVALARTVNLPLETFKRCIAALMEPDPDSNSQVHEGRRLIPSESGRGYFIVNYATYRSIKTAEEKKAYMREYMTRYRKAKSGKDVTAVKPCKELLTVLAHAEGEGEGESEGEGKPTQDPSPASAKPKGVVDGKASDLLPTSENAKRVAVIFKRRLTTAWSAKEKAAFMAIGTIDPGDLQLMEEFYAAPLPSDQDFRRHDLKTCLNNWQGEVDKARKWKAGQNGQARQMALPKLPGHR